MSAQELIRRLDFNGPDTPGRLKFISGLGQCAGGIFKDSIIIVNGVQTTVGGYVSEHESKSETPAPPPQE